MKNVSNSSPKQPGQGYQNAGKVSGVKQTAGG